MFRHDGLLRLIWDRFRRDTIRSRVFVGVDGQSLRRIRTGFRHGRNRAVLGRRGLILASIPRAAHGGVLYVTDYSRIVDRLGRRTSSAFFHLRLRLHHEHRFLDGRFYHRRVSVGRVGAGDLHPFVGERGFSRRAVRALATLGRALTATLGRALTATLGRALTVGISARQPAEQYASRGTFESRVNSSAGIVRLIKAVLAGIGGLRREVTDYSLYRVGYAAFRRAESTATYRTRLASAKHCWATLEATSDAGGGANGTGSRAENKIDGRSHAHTLGIELPTRLGFVVNGAKARVVRHLLLELFVRELVGLLVNFFLDQARIDRAAGRRRGNRSSDGFGHDTAGYQRGRHHGGHVGQLKRRSTAGVIPEVFTCDSGRQALLRFIAHAIADAALYTAERILDGFCELRAVLAFTRFVELPGSGRQTTANSGCTGPECLEVIPPTDTFIRWRGSARVESEVLKRHFLVP